MHVGRLIGVEAEKPMTTKAPLFHVSDLPYKFTGLGALPLL